MGGSCPRSAKVRCLPNPLLQSTHAFFLQASQGRLGSSYVQARCYAFGDSEHLLIKPESWAMIVRPGSKLTMSIVVNKSTPCCPYCLTTSAGSEAEIFDHYTLWYVLVLYYRDVRKRLMFIKLCVHAILRYLPTFARHPRRVRGCQLILSARVIPEQDCSRPIIYSQARA